MSLQVTIPSGTALSGTANIAALYQGGGVQKLMAIAMPAGWDAASLTFQVSVDGGTTWLNAYDSSGTEIAATAAASHYIYLPPAAFAAAGVLRVRSGTGSVPVNQTADRVLTLVTTPQDDD